MPDSNPVLRQWLKSVSLAEVRASVKLHREMTDPEYLATLDLWMAMTRTERTALEGLKAACSGDGGINT